MKSVEAVFDAFKEKTVLVIGDVMIDSYVFGSETTFSEAHVPIINSIRKEKRLGGAANVALNIQSLEATPILCSVVGDDRDGQTFEHLLKCEGMTNKGIIRSQNRITTNKLRILSGTHQLLRVDSEDVHPLVDLDRKTLLHHIFDLIKECDLIIFVDYDKGTIHSKVISETIKLAKELKIPVAANPKKQNFLSYKGATLFNPSVSELESMYEGKIDFRNSSNLNKAMDRVHEIISAENYIISLKGGDIYFQSKKGGKFYFTHHSGVSDMSGVGNTIISIAGLGLTLGLDLEVIAELVNIGASIVAEYSGVVPIKKDQFLNKSLKNDILTNYFH